MSHTVEQLLHDTLSARAATVGDAPGFAGPPISQPHRRWPALLAAAAVVAVAAGVLAVRGGDETAPPAADGLVHACRAALPDQWRTALRATPDTVDGRPTHPLTITPDGDVIVSWQARDRSETVGITDRRGTTRSLYTLPAGHRVVAADTDGRYLVVNSDHLVGAEPSAVDAIVAVELSTGRVQDVLTGRPGLVVASKYGAVVQDGIAYWTAATPAATPAAPSRNGRILSFDLRTHALVRTAHVDDPVAVVRSAAGVAWDGGSVPAPHLPAGVPAATLTGSDFAHTDGTAFAWTDAGDGRVVDWTDTDGRSRSVVVDLPGVQTQGVQGGVSGDLVTVVANTADSVHVYALDTRTGALGDLGRDNNVAAVGRNTIALDSPDGTVRLDTSALPPLTC